MIRSSVWLLISFAIAAHAQVKTAREMWNGTGVLDSGVTLKYKTVVEPPLKNSAFAPMGGTFGVSGNTMQHCISDRAAQSYFGYEMTVWPGENESSRKVVFGPVNLARIRQALKAVAGDLPLNPAPLPRYPPPQTAYSGDTIAMDFMVSPDGRERIVDYIQFSFGQKPPTPPKAETAAPQDFTVDDGAVRAELDQPEVSIDGKKFGGNVVAYAPHGGVTIWIYFPGRGRFVLSLAPHEGFVKAGVVRAGTISFAMDGHDYETRLSEPIAGVEKAWNLYVMRDAGYLPRSALVNAVVMGADRLENLLGK